MVLILLILATILIIILLIKLFYTNNTKNINDNMRIKSLLRQSGRYSVAALQDQDAAIAVLHGDYAAAYFYALLDIYSEEEVGLAVPDLDILNFKKEIQNVQSTVTKRLYEICPNIIPNYSPANLINASQL